MHTERTAVQFTHRTMRVDVVSAKLGVAEPTVWRWVKTESFPKPILLSPGVSAWLEHEVDDWLMARAALR